MYRIFSIVIPVLLCIVLFSITPILYVIRQMGKPPDNSPEQFTKRGGRGGRAAEQKIVVCAGASIVHGRAGYNFVDLLARRYSTPGREHSYLFVNAGVNGDTSYHLLGRLDSIIACDPDLVIVLVGTNDIICTLNSKSWLMYKGDKRLPQQPTIELYRANLQAIVRQLKGRTHASIALCALPVMGEDLLAVANERVREFNAVLRQVAEQEDVAFLPIYDAEATFLTERQRNAEGRYPHGRPFTSDATESLRLGFLANLQHYLFGRSYDAIARANGMELKVDMLHSTSREASIIAGQIAPFISRDGEGTREVPATGVELAAIESGQ